MCDTSNMKRINIFIALCVTFCSIFLFFSCQKDKVSADYSVWAPDVSYSPDAKPENLSISFYASVAKIEDVGKEPSSPISITPSISGNWKWINDSFLEFTPNENWQLGTKYTVSIPSSDLQKHIYLKTNPTFETSKFEVSLTDSEFYINPTDPTEKRAIWTITSSHPMKKDGFEKLVSVSLTIPGAKGDKGSVKQKYAFSVSFSENLLSAEIVSDAIPMPPRTSKMNLKISGGIEAMLEIKGANVYKKGFESEVAVPGMTDFVSIKNVSQDLALNENQNYDQILTIETKGQIQSEEILKHTEVFILPKDRPSIQGWKEEKDCKWTMMMPDMVTDEILSLSTKIDLEEIPSPEVASNTNSFKIKCPASSYIFIKIKGELDFFGGYKLTDGKNFILQVKDYPKELKIVSEGTILSLSGTKKLSIYSRGIGEVEYKISRIMVDDINHLVAMSNGDMKNFKFTNYNFNENNISEKTTSSYKILDASENTASYFAYDFTSQLKNDSQKKLKNGLFIFEVNQSKDDKMNKGEVSNNYRNSYSSYNSYANNSVGDKRLILVTDLGFIVKRSIDGSRDIFVQSVSSGNPVANATVSVIGLNGNTVLSTTTDSRGHAYFPNIDAKIYTGEHQPVAFIVKTDSDLSFMPYSERGRFLDYSNFDVGGVYGFDEPKKINSFIFSDRGIYRPGEKVHIGIISKSGDWKENLSNVPVEVEVVDSRGSVLFTNRFKLSASGFDEISFETQPYSPTGLYYITLYRIEEKQKETERFFINSQQIKVEEFLPDTLRISTNFDPLPSTGWIMPQELNFNITLANLFGTPARSNEVKAQMDLSSGFPYISKYGDYIFSDPYNKGNYHSEFLGTKITDNNGNATFTIDMSKFEKATYKMKVFAEGFEKESGRSVTRSSVVYVSPLSYLIGYKADGDLNYISKDDKRKLSLIAINQNLEQINLNEVNLKIEEVKYISSLVKQPNGIYKYQSVKKNYLKNEEKIDIAKTGTEIFIPTSEDGDFVLSLIDKDGLVFNKINYTVVGQENQARSLTRTAELELKLEKSDLQAGENAKIFIKAPYTGSGLITVERDKIYTYKWFTQNSLSSVQTIEIPKELEGNAYINVMFTRSSSSKEIFMSPFCYGAVPFSIDKSKRTNKIHLDLPNEVKSGSDLEIKYSSEKPGKIVIFAVDEGILQVGSYRMPDPLSFFFKKRALQVRTSQILDLILPEYNVLKTVTATGGGAGMEAMMKIANNQNPFSRKVSESVAFWSGILDTSATTRTVKYHIPDYFNGNLKVMAIAVNTDSIGTFQGETLGTNTFIISPNVPLVASPGDEFDISVTVTNNKKGSGENAEIKLEVSASENFEIVGEKNFSEKISEGKEKTFSIRIKTLEKLGNGEILFTAKDKDDSSIFTSTLSVRPPVPYRVWIESGYVQSGETKKAKTEVKHTVYDEFSTRTCSVSTVMSSFLTGISYYLEKYPYGCSEQITSQAFPYLYSDFVKISEKTETEAKDFVNSTISILQSRLTANGGIGFWTSASRDDDFITLYCTDFLMEAKQNDYYVSSSFFDTLMNTVEKIASKSSTDEYSIYLRSYAIYLLTKNENVKTSLLEKIEEDVSKEKLKISDYDALYLAASYKMLKLDKKANEMIEKASISKKFDSSWAFHTNLHYISTYADITCSYFPEKLKTVNAALIENMTKEISDKNYTTLSVASTIRALKSLANATENASFKISAKVATKVTGDTKAKVADDTNSADTAKVADKMDDTNSAGNKTMMLELKGKISSFGSSYYAEFPSNATEILYEKEKTKDGKNVPMFYQTVISGYEKTMPKKEVKNGIEIFREYTNLDGSPLKNPKLGDDVLVKISFRSSSANGQNANGLIRNVAIVDIQPSCLEADIESVRENEKLLGRNIDYVDSREDRIIIYASVNNNLSSFSYRAKLVNSGTFVVPPLFAECMYNEKINAYSSMGNLEVSKEK